MGSFMFLALPFFNICAFWVQETGDFSEVSLMKFEKVGTKSLISVFKIGF